MIFVEDSYESDGEFPEDQLLQILRAQRSSYEEKLGYVKLNVDYSLFYSGFFFISENIDI